MDKDLDYQYYIDHINIQEALNYAGYRLNRRDGTRWPSYVRVDDHGQRVRGDKFLVSIDMDSEPTYIEAFFSMIKPELFRIYNLLYQCKPNGRKHIHINYDTDESRWQVNGFKCGKYGIDDVRELDLVNCELQSSRFYSCNLMNCTITDCSVSDGSLIGSCEISDCTIENCYCGQDTTISRCHIVANNTMDGRVEKSVIGDNNSYTEKASIDSESRNRNNRKP